MNQESHISRLIYRCLTGSITPDERAELTAWLDANEANRRFFDSLTNPAALDSEYRSRTMIDPTRPAADMERRIAASRRRVMMRRMSRAAAAVILLCAAGTGIWYAADRLSLGTSQAAYTENTTPDAPKTIDDIVVGTTCATVTDASGHTIALSADESGKDATAHFTARSTRATDAEQLCLEVPRGGEFKVVLEDSTEVWLNSESTLRYPETFSERERRVSVSGEAYFHVRKDASRPFYVVTDGQVIRVYGTTFNVRAYGDEPAVYTTLETGSISIAHPGVGRPGEIFMSAGHQAILDHDTEDVRMTVVDPTVVTSWRHGRFVFENQPLERIMRDLSRWYNFEYEFADTSLAERVFMGSIPRYGDFRTAIQILENCGGITFALTPDNKILISGK